MAKVPLLSPGIVPFDAPAYTLNAICAAPGCDQPTQDPHHLWRRSFLAGAYDWVQIPERLIIGNVIGLCRAHHDQIERSAAWITLEEDNELWWTGLLTPAQMLAWQPPRYELETSTHPEALAEAVAELGYQNGQEPEDQDVGSVEPLTDEQIDRFEEAIGLKQDPTICPSCKRPLPHPKLDGPPEAPRARRTWSITVPKDERENGADVLDELLDASREKMGTLGLPYGEENSVRYFVLSAALALFVQHADQLMGDG